MTWCPPQMWGICLTFFTAFKSPLLFILYFSAQALFLTSCQLHRRSLCTSKWQSKTRYYHYQYSPDAKQNIARKCQVVMKYGAENPELVWHEPWSSYSHVQQHQLSMRAYKHNSTTLNPFWLPISPLAVGKYKSWGAQGVSLGQSEVLFVVI